jgi:hypothetical protein
VQCAISPCRTSRRHTAQKQVDEVTIYYPYHPQYKKNIRILHKKKHQGESHVVIEQPDGSYAFLPEWMTLPEAMQYSLVSTPLVSLTALHELQRFISHSFHPDDVLKLSGGKNEKKAKAKTPTNGIVSNTGHARAIIPSIEERNCCTIERVNSSSMETTKKRKSR